jgi:4-amino-4-deoxy-L-arabinose transferase-like glycosyltransferase
MDVPTVSRLLLALLVAAYVLPGLFGHGPWKPDEPYTFGAVLHMARTGDWIVPSVGMEAFVEKPPFYYWVSSATLWLLSGVLPLHDAARVASLVLVLATLAATGAAAALLWGEGAAALAVLLFLATLGVESHAQRMQVDLALLFGFSVAALGFAGCARERRWGGVALGLGVGVGFLAKGVLAPAVIGVTALLLPALFAQWRRRGYLAQLAVALLVALPALLVWPLALYRRSPELFAEWFWSQNVGRFAGYAVARSGAASERGGWSQSFAWFLFPLWLYAIAAVVREGARAWRHAGMQIGLTLSLVAAMVLAVSASMRAIYFLPLAPGLVIVAVAALRRPESAAERALGFVAIALGSAAALYLWAVWALLVTRGDLPAAPFIGRYLPLPFAMPVLPLPLAAAVALTAGFAVLVAIRRRIAAPSLTLWVAALALCWGLAHTLWLPWLDAAKSYRQIFEAARARLPPRVGCVVMDGPGESERAMAEYWMAITPRRRFLREQECGALLWMGNAQKGHPWPGPDWRFAWGGGRAGDRDERFELFVRP